MRVAKRSLIVLRQVADPGGLIARSIATQPPWGVDNLRIGAHINAALFAAGHPEMVRSHNLEYVDLQSRVGNPQTPAIPFGTWPTDVYSDGTRATPIPYEVDAVGYGAWTLWLDYLKTRNDGYLYGRAFPAIRDAAIFLTDVCRDPSTGLQCTAHEDGGPNPRQSIRGAQAAWKGLDAAVEVGVMIYGPNSSTVKKFRPRRNELRDAIDDNFFTRSCRCYTQGLADGYQVGGSQLWPLELTEYGSRAADSQAARNWAHVSRAMSGRLRRGSLELRAILGNAHAWAGATKKMAKVRKALRWVATVPATTNGLLGEAWMRFPNPKSAVVTMQGQPDAWSHAMFYLAALKAYGRAAYDFRN